MTYLFNTTIFSNLEWFFELPPTQVIIVGPIMLLPIIIILVWTFISIGYSLFKKIIRLICNLQYKILNNNDF